MPSIQQKILQQILSKDINRAMNKYNIVISIVPTDSLALYIIKFHGLL